MTFARPALAALLLAAPAVGQPVEKAAPAAAPKAVTAAAKAEAPKDERVAVIGALDKRLGTTAEFTLKPGERFSFGRLTGVLQTCEKTQPFERKQSAAFVQIIDTPRPLTRGEQPKPRQVFSGWLFAESPSLNPMQHPVYDVWLKSCTMRFPDGPKPPAAPGKAKAPSRRASPSAPAPSPVAAPPSAEPSSPAV